jgi:pimeloyl-ACP methyl ester carboxylesterase
MIIKKAYVDIHDGQIHYRSVEADRGTPLVLFHRAPSSSLSFEKMMSMMAGDRPMYAFDTPGYGQSFDPPGMPDILAYHDWMVEAIDRVGLDTFHIFGHHTGTHFGTEMATAYPDRVRSLMLNGIAYLTAAEREQFRQGMSPPQTPDSDGAYALDIWNRLKGLAKNFDAETMHQDYVGSLRSLVGRPQSFNAVWGQDYPAILAKVTCPILATSAEDDLFAPYLDRVAEAHPNAKTVVLGPAMIWTPELDTECVVREVRNFLKDVEGAHA